MINSSGKESWKKKFIRMFADPLNSRMTQDLSDVAERLWHFQWDSDYDYAHGQLRLDVLASYNGGGEKVAQYIKTEFGMQPFIIDELRIYEAAKLAHAAA